MEGTRIPTAKCGTYLAQWASDTAAAHAHGDDERIGRRCGGTTGSIRRQPGNRRVRRMLEYRGVAVRSFTTLRSSRGVTRANAQGSARWAARQWWYVQQQQVGRGGAVAKYNSLSLLSLIWLCVARLSCLRWHQGRKGARGIHWNRLDVAGDGAVGVERGAKDRCGRRWRGRRRLQGGAIGVRGIFLLVFKLSMGGRRHPSLPSQLRRARQGAAAHMISTV